VPPSRPRTSLDHRIGTRLAQTRSIEGFRPTLCPSMRSSIATVCLVMRFSGILTEGPFAGRSSSRGMVRRIVTCLCPSPTTVTATRSDAVPLPLADKRRLPPERTPHHLAPSRNQKAAQTTAHSAGGLNAPSIAGIVAVQGGRNALLCYASRHT
jgi:hypothetical protein